jgi:hypothetical protein
LVLAAVQVTVASEAFESEPLSTLLLALPPLLPLPLDEEPDEPDELPDFVDFAGAAGGAD